MAAFRYSKKRLQAEQDVPLRAYSVRSFAAAHDVSISKVYAEMNSGRLKSVWRGGMRIIPVECAEEWLRVDEPEGPTNGGA